VLTVVALALFGRPPGTYYAGVRVVFYEPSQSPRSVPFLNTSVNAINMASAVRLAVVGRQSDAKPTFDSVTLLDTGVKNGYSVTLPNRGGQWAYNFDQPILDVEVTGPTPAAVRSRISTLIAQIQAETIYLQKHAGSATSRMIQTTVTPSSLSIYRGEGSHVRSAAAILVLGVGTVTAAAVTAEGRSRRLALNEG
jgi:hypothetical protein